jgi:hypothetical protein
MHVSANTVEAVQAQQAAKCFLIQAACLPPLLQAAMHTSFCNETVAVLGCSCSVVWCAECSSLLGLRCAVRCAGPTSTSLPSLRCYASLHAQTPCMCRCALRMPCWLTLVQQPCRQWAGCQSFGALLPTWVGLAVSCKMAL